VIISSLELGFEKAQDNHAHFVVAVAPSAHKARTLEDVLDISGHLEPCDVLILPHPNEGASEATARLIKKHGIHKVKWA